MAVRSQQSPGSTWRWIDPYPTGVDLRDVTPTARGTVIAVGDYSTIVELTISGELLQSRTLGTPSQLQAITFRTAKDGWAVGTGSLVARTSDGGNTWSTDSVGTAGMFLDVAFSDPSTGVIVGGGPLAGAGLLRTVDSGASWSVPPAWPCAPATMGLAGASRRYRAIRV